MALQRHDLTPTAVRTEGMSASVRPESGAEASIEVCCPADGRVVGTVPDLGVGEVRAITEQLRSEQAAWEALGPAGRRPWLIRYAAWLRANQVELAGLIQSESGRPWQEATSEVPVVLDLITYYAREADTFLAEEHPRPHGLFTATKKLTIAYRPHAVVGVISPWNFPLMIALGDAVPALAAGAAVLIKPSELTPLAARRAVEGWQEIGAPAVFAWATGGGETGAAVVGEVDYVQFTGSTRTGIAVARHAAERLVPCSLELGGKDAAIVLADADIERAANGIVWGALFNAGQACTSVERVYVESPVYDEFVGRVVEKVKALRQGQDDCGYRFDVGPLATAVQLGLVEAHVNDALAAGARALTGGARSALGHGFYEPTVLVDVDHSMRCIREETFGPTIPIVRVADADEAIALANDSRYGLSASVWTRDAKRGGEVARAIEAGAVNVNDMYTNVSALPLPLSGWKQSGIGARFGGADGVRKYCRTQAITQPRVTPSSELIWFPYTARRGRIVSVLLRAVLALDRRPRLRLPRLRSSAVSDT